MVRRNTGWLGSPKHNLRPLTFRHAGFKEVVARDAVVGDERHNQTSDAVDLLLVWWGSLPRQFTPLHKGADTQFKNYDLSLFVAGADGRVSLYFRYLVSKS